ncbi:MULTISPECIES: maleylacetoacetate isomerase [Sphingosinicellaceae]|uniref:maleylacetoacetate isomerase n=1 Tax=Sphingosinicellaceae TaxID=2820280 RepID=UPI001C1E7595|nr:MULTISPECIES: maleylacetoacetate isomerase [Polymorphobacter]QYE34878.1 maleylacetoacetate isomerase [Polymorphobacter sp. PAMC 29334]UAJ11769.1 maleylacetoacetate isomerase [Polymorphobacter megasporae]
MTTRTLYGYWRSSASYRVRIALAIKGLAYDQVAINLAKGAQSGIGFKLLNPQGFVPYLIDGDTGLNQSLAIIEYLDEVYPEPPLLPGDPIGRARVRGVAQQIACDIHPVNNLRVLNYLRGPLAQPQEAVDTWYRHWIEVGFEALEEIAEVATGEYLFGDTVTLADICLVPQMWNARRLQADIARFPKLSAIDVRLNGLPAVAAARPERQPDAVK